MPKDNRSFFKQKKIWSEVKDELFGCYMVPYFNKILSMGNPILYDFYNEYGVLCDLSRLSSGRGGSGLKTLEKSRYIEIQRSPAVTEKGKLSTFWQEGKGKTLSLRKRS